jgi:hypothetical protein
VRVLLCLCDSGACLLCVHDHDTLIVCLYKMANILNVWPVFFNSCHLFALPPSWLQKIFQLNILCNFRAEANGGGRGEGGGGREEGGRGEGGEGGGRGGGLAGILSIGIACVLAQWRHHHSKCFWYEDKLFSTVVEHEGGRGGGDMQRIFRQTHGQFDRQIDS